jgi:cyclic dehypoxanthinyl futalosine synthase
LFVRHSIVAGIYNKKNGNIIIISQTDTIIARLRAGERINHKDSLYLLTDADLMVLAETADYKRKSLHPQPLVTFVVDRNINYTNVCMSKCLFCAFYRHADHDDAYIISKNEISQKISETLELGGTQILLQGGMHPALELDYYLDLLKFIKTESDIHIHGFSPPEISYLSKKTSLSVSATLEKLIEAGLDSIPGGGAEILVDEVRQKLSPDKCTADEWLDVMRCAHRLGLKSSATMMFGHIEKPYHIIEHLLKIRELQDETAGFTAFIPWTFQPKNTKVNCLTATAAEYLRVLALSRLVLDNIPNIQASWVTQGDKIAQTSLAFGANDMGSTMIEENVVAAAGVDYMLPKNALLRLIQKAGYIPRQRDCFYNLLPEQSEYK